MGTPQLSRVLAHLRNVLVKHDTARLSDGGLLTLYVRQRDEAAFEALVRRHGPMVLGVCRRVLHNSHDVEDAFQATMLVLVRKAASLRTPGKVGNWLYGVAYRTALEARKVAAKRRAKEAMAPPPTETPESVSSDLRAVLDQELDRLPDKFRAAIVLCDLEGMTRKEAAHRLGWPDGTVASRLASARKLLANRLSRRQRTLSAGAVAALVSENSSACLPPWLVSTAMRVASLSGPLPTGLISAQVVALTQGVMKSMLLTKLKIAAAVCLLAGLTSCGIGMLTHKVLSAAPTAQAQGAPPKAPATDRQKAGEEAAKTTKQTTALRAAPARVLVEHKSSVMCLAWSPDGGKIAAGAQDQMMHVTEVATSKEIHTFPINATATALAFSPDGKKLAISLPGEPTGLWDIDAGKQQVRGNRAGAGSAPFTHIALAPDGETVTALAVGQLVRTGPNGAFGMGMSAPGGGSAAISSDGSFAGWCDARGMIRVFEPAQQRGPAMSMAFQLDGVQCIAFGPGGKWLAAGGDKGVQLWDLPSKTNVRTLSGLEKPTAQLSVSANGHALAALAADGVTIRVWDLTRDRMLCQMNQMDGAVGLHALSPDGKLLATTTKGGKKIHLWKVAARQLAQATPPLKLTAVELSALWADMGNQDAEKADAAWKKLGAAGDNAVSFIGEQVRPIATPPFDAKRLDKLVAELDSDQFATRDRAMRDLLELGELAIVPLQRHLEKGLSLEASKRARSIIEKIGQPALTTERRRVLEAIDLLENLRTANALELLREVERDALIPQIQHEARQALQRLSQEATEKK